MSASEITSEFLIFKELTCEFIRHVCLEDPVVADHQVVPQDGREQGLEPHPHHHLHKVINNINEDPKIKK